MRKTTPPMVHLILRSLLAIFALSPILLNGQQQFDVALSKTTVTLAPVKYGTPVPFNLTIYNQGTDSITNVELIEHLGDGFEFQGALNPTWSVHPTISNAFTTTYTSPIPPGQNRIVTLNLVVRPGDERIDWINTAEVVSFTDMSNINREPEDTDSNGDEIPNNDAGGLLGSPADNYVNGDGTGAINDGVAATDEDDHDSDTIKVFDLALTKILNPITGYSYGDTLTFTTTVYNQGNMPARVVRIRDIIPEGYINPIALNVSNGWTNDPENPVFTIDEIEPFENVTVTIKLILGTEAFDANAWTNYVEIISARDINLVNVSALDADSTPASNTAGERSVQEGDPDDNYIGNNPVNSGDQDDHDPAEPVVFDLALKKERATALSSFNYGTPIDYIYTIVNQGNVDVSQIVVKDSLPCGAMFEQIYNPDWTYDANTKIATRIINTPLLAGTQMTGELVLTVIPCAIDQETAWTNYMEIFQATTADGVQTTEIDGVFDDNFRNDAGGVPLSASDNKLDGIGTVDEDNHDVELLQVYDLALKKELITPGPYYDGQELDFRIRVYNQGNIVIEDLVIEDFVPPGYTYSPATNAPLGWTNSYTTLVSGVPTTFPDTLNVMNDIFLATEDSLDIFIKMNFILGSVDVSDWYNFAHIWVARDTVGNNRFDDADSNPFTTTALEFAVIPGSPADNDVLSKGKSVTPKIEEDDHDVANISFFDLALEKTVTQIPTEYEDYATFEIVVSNEGTDFAHDITVVDYLPCGLVFEPGLNAGWNVNGISGNPEYFYTDTLFSGESFTATIVLQVVECASPTINAWRNVAEVKNALAIGGIAGNDQDSDPDDNPFNDLPDEDDSDDAIINVFDLSLTKNVVNGLPEYEIGETVTYSIQVRNEGNQAASNIGVVDYIPCGMSLAPGNVGWSINPAGYAVRTIAGPIQPNFTQTIQISLVIEDCVISSLTRINVAEIYRADSPISSPSGDFDSTPDDIPSNDLVGEDDIDNVSIAVAGRSLIGDFVFHDIDGDGIQDGGEPGIPGVMAILYNGIGQLVQVTETDAVGFYQFLDVPPGNYYVVFVNENDDFEPTTPFAGTNFNDSNITGEFGPGSTSIFEVFPGEDNETIDGGFFQCVLIKGVTFYDINEDDKRQTTENGINGLDVNLYRKVNGVWVLWDSQTTHHDYATPSDDGIWDFCVAPGTYYIEVLMPPIGLVLVRPFIGGINFDSDINGANGPNTTPSFTINPGGSKTNLGAGYYPMATVGNTVWHDENANGIQEDNEAKISGVKVEVYNIDNEKIDEAITNNEGLYKVEYLAKESYYLKFEAPEGFTFTFANATVDEDKDSDVTNAMGINTTNLIAFNPGDEIIYVDAGIISGALPLRWKEFTVRAEEIHNNLTWKTSLETNVEYFEVERKVDNESEFTALQRIEAVGNSTTIREYQYFDDKVGVGRIYNYRIKQVDLDGLFSYSEVREVTRKSDLSIRLYPNPTSGKLTINGDFEIEKSYILHVINSTGGKIYESEKSAANQQIEIDLNHLVPGIYQLMIYDQDNQIYQERIIKL